MNKPAKTAIEKKIAETKTYKKLEVVFTNVWVKRGLVVLGVLFLVLSLFISLDPQAFIAYGYLGVFVFNLFGPGTLLVPIVAPYMNIFGLALAAALGVVINDSVSWVVGKSGDAVIPKSNWLNPIEYIVVKYGFTGLLVLSIIPGPYDIIGLIMGYLDIPYKKFLLPAFLGKLIRFIILGWIGQHFALSIEEWREVLRFFD